MALIACPNPSCSHEVVNNWPSCPKCHCPIQVLLAAQAAKAAEEAAIAQAEAELEAEKPSGKMLQRLKESARDDDDYYDDDLAEENLVEKPPKRDSLVHKIANALSGIGIFTAIGVPVAALEQPAVATLLGVVAGVCGIAGFGLQKFADEWSRRP